MIVDTSALIAILRDEPEAAACAEAIQAAPLRRMSAANFLEAAIVIDGSRDPVASRRLDDLIKERSEERRVGKSVDLGGRRIIKKKKLPAPDGRHRVWCCLALLQLLDERLRLRRFVRRRVGRNHAFFFQAEDGIRDLYVTGVQTCALPICGQAVPSSSTFWVRRRSPKPRPIATRAACVNSSKRCSTQPKVGRRTTCWSGM